MYDLTELYDGLVAIRRAQQVLPETVSRETRADLKVTLKRIEGKLIVALSHFNADELARRLLKLSTSYTLARPERNSKPHVVVHNVLSRSLR